MSLIQIKNVTARPTSSIYFNLIVTFFDNRQFSVRSITYTVNRYTLYGKYVISEPLKETVNGKMQSN
jgi:hypothetical protein